MLRHDPASAGLQLDRNGWADVDDLMAALELLHWSMSYAELEEVVTSSSKQRFALDPANRRIRAHQGHSIPVDLGLTAEPPPTLLFHGTVERFLLGIRRDGLMPGRRHHVHLSPDVTAAEQVGSRRGDPVVLAVDAGAMDMDGAEFFRTVNGVWLTDRVPADRIRFPGEISEDPGPAGWA